MPRAWLVLPEDVLTCALFLVGEQAKNRVHLDLRGAPGLAGEARMAVLEAEAERLVAHGAERVDRYEPAPPFEGGHIVLTDPEGNEFCLD